VFLVAVHISDGPLGPAACGLGFLVAAGLAFMSMVRVHPSGPKRFEYRSEQQWMAEGTLFVTERGFPWGRSVFGENADPSRFAELATIYARLATGDGVHDNLVKMGPIDDNREHIAAYPVLSNDLSTNSPPLPLIQLQVMAATPARAVLLEHRETEAFREYLESEQESNAIPVDKRVVITPVKQSRAAVLLQGRSKTLPIVVFMTVMMAVIGLSFMLENIRPRVRLVDGAESASPARRTA